MSNLNPPPLMSKVPDILELYHTDHPGMNSMLSSTCEKYYWVGMTDEIKNYVSLPIYLP